MCLEPASFAGQRHVDEVLLVTQRFELASDVRLEVVPAQAELLVARHLRPVPVL